jgi:hypothetical protein
MKKEYWEVEDSHLEAKTGKKISEWVAILDEYGAAEKKTE